MQFALEAGMDIKQILFQAVADSGSFARASERLHISQPAISAADRPIGDGTQRRIDWCVMLAVFG